MLSNEHGIDSLLQMEPQSTLDSRLVPNSLSNKENGNPEATWLKKNEVSPADGQINSKLGYRLPYAEPCANKPSSLWNQKADITEVCVKKLSGHNTRLYRIYKMSCSFSAA